MADIMDNLEDEAARERVKNEVLEVCGRFPVYS